MYRERLAIPGPTPVPERVLAAMHRQPINHRGFQFEELMQSVSSKLCHVFKTQNPVYVFPSSGTGMMEAAVLNCFSPGDRVLVLVNGLFGNRFVDICKRHNLLVERIDCEWGNGVSSDALHEKLKKAAKQNNTIKGVLFQHNETSTGVLNDAKSILEVIEMHGAISVVDAISGLVAAPFYQDKWGADVVLGASQKGFMMCPGLAFVSLSAKALYAIKSYAPCTFYFDIGKTAECFLKKQVYYTPAVNLMFGLSEGLDMILEEGLENCWERHRNMMRMVRSQMRAWQLPLLAGDKEASPSVTAVRFPEPDKLIAHLEKKYNVIISGGYGELAGEIFRLAHLGYVDEADMRGILWALRNTLFDLGYFPV